MVPLNLDASQVMPIGGQMVSFAIRPRVYLESTRGGPAWGVRFAFTLLFPR